MPNHYVYGTGSMGWEPGPEFTYLQVVRNEITGQGAVVAAWSDGLGADDIDILNMDHSDECEHAWKFVCIVGNAPAYRCEQCRAEKHD